MIVLEFDMKNFHKNLPRAIVTFVAGGSLLFVGVAFPMRNSLTHRVGSAPKASLHNKKLAASSPRVIFARAPLKLPAPPSIPTASSPLDLRFAFKGNSVSTLSFSSDGEMLATTPMSLKLWSVKTGKLKATLNHASYPIVARAIFSPVKLLAAVLLGNDRTEKDALVLWNIESGQIVRKLERPQSKEVAWTDFAFSPNGKLLATTQGEGKHLKTKVRLWDVQTGKLVRTLSDIAADQIVFSPDGKTLAGAAINYIRVWDVATGKLVHSFYHPGITSLAFSHDGAMLSGISDKSNGFGGVVTLWNAHSGQQLHQIQTEWYTPKSLIFAPDDKKLIVGGGTYPMADAKMSESRNSGYIAFYDVKSGKLQSFLDTRNQSLVTALALAPDGKTLATGESGISFEDGVKLWNLK